MSREPAVKFIFITLVLNIMGIGIVAPVLPDLLQDLMGAPLSKTSIVYGLIMGSYALMQFLFAPLLGVLSDRFGRRPIVLISLFGTGIDYFLLWSANTLPMFIIARMVGGITASNISAASAYIADVSPPEKRSANFGMIGAAFGVGFVFGPALGGLLGHFDPRLPFVGAGILTLANVAYGFFVLPESLKPENRKKKIDWSRTNPVGSLRSLKRFPIVYGLAGAHFLYALAHQTLPSTWILFTEYRFDWNNLQQGLSLAFVGVMAAVVSGGLSRRLIPKWGERKTIIIAGVFNVIAFVSYGFNESAVLVFLIIVIGSMGGLFHPSSQGMISKSVGDDEQGAVQGAVTSLVGVAGFIGPMLATFLFGYFINESRSVQVPGAAFFSGAILTAVAVVLAVRSFRATS